MTGAPKPALILGWLGLAPFVYGAAMVLAGPGALPAVGMGPDGAAVLARYGAVILGFMGGCLWGFAAARPGGPTFALLSASVAPALAAFAALGAESPASCLWLALGFAALLVIDGWFQRAGVAPVYWLRLRLPLTSGAVASLLVGAVYG